MLNPYSLLGGLATLTLFILDGALFLALKTMGDLRREAMTAARLSGAAAVVAGGGFLAWTEFSYRAAGHVATGVASVISGLRGGGRAAGRPGGRGGLTGEREGLAFARRRGRHRGRHRRAVHRPVPERAAVHHQRRLHPDHRQRVLDGEDAGGDDRRRLHLPAVRPAYQGWTYWVFRKRLGAPPQPAPATEPQPPQAPEPQPPQAPGSQQPTAVS